MADQGTLRDYVVPTIEGCSPSITRPPVAANNFEIKPAIIRMIQQSVQFGGNSYEDPILHIASFIEICDIFKANEVTNDAIRLRLFSFSLRDKAKGWVMSLPAGAITTWDELAQKFLAKYFPPVKVAKMRNDIISFMQGNDESLYEAWERYMELLRKCPHHDLPVWMQVQIFYNGLLPNVQVMVDMASGGTLNYKTPEAAYELLEVLASNNHQRPSDKAIPKKTIGLHDVDAFTALSAQISTLQKQLGGMKVNSIQSPLLICEFCASNHASVEYQVENPFSSSTNEQVNHMGSSQRPQNDLNSNTYNSGWRNHPNFSWSNQEVPSSADNYQLVDERMTKLEDMFAMFMQETTNFMNETRKNFKIQGVSIRNLEVQMGQLMEQLTKGSQ